MNRQHTPLGLPLYSEQEFVQRAAEKQLPSELAVIKGFVSTVKATKESNRFKFKISTDGIDRDKDVISIDGWDVTSYKQNPVVLFGHDYHSLPVGKSISIVSGKKSLDAEVEFASAEIYPFAETVRRMVAGGFLNAASVGFKPKKYAYNEERRGVDVLESELLEWSIVPVPANPECLVQLSAALTPEMLAEFAGPCEQFLKACKGKGQWVVETDLKAPHAEKDVPVLDLDVLADKLKALILPDLKSAMPEQALPKPESDASSQEKQAQEDEFVFEDEADYVFGIHPNTVATLVRDTTRALLKEQVSATIRAQINYQRGRISE